MTLTLGLADRRALMLRRGGPRDSGPGAKVMRAKSLEMSMVDLFVSGVFQEFVFGYPRRNQTGLSGGFIVAATDL